jgi:transcriptional regulator with XRE-family HTH domain
MEINQHKVKTLRTDRGWTQQQLADICALSMRTIQRVEVHGLASYETVNALAAAFQINRAELFKFTLDVDIGLPPLTPTAPELHWPQLLLLFGAGVLTGAVVVWWWLA